ncbi:MAG TPA: hypothetical protein DCG57_16740, partial [Candidatus Riflebacteria bacterium]|nr:hypothetical protein [Candidatus Riflebacteria bacterium]
GASFRFEADAAYQQSHFRMASQSLANNAAIAREKSDGMRSAEQLIEKIPQAQSVLAFKDAVMKKVSPVLENPDGRLFMPMFNVEGQSRMPQQDFSDAEGRRNQDFNRKESGRSSRERYFVGYRLSAKAKQADENWYFALGWKSGVGGRGFRGLSAKDSGDDNAQRTSMLADSENSSQNAAKVEYSGPIVGIVGQF